MINRVLFGSEKLQSGRGIDLFSWDAVEGWIFGLKKQSAATLQANKRGGEFVLEKNSFSMRRFSRCLPRGFRQIITTSPVQALSNYKLLVNLNKPTW